MKKLLAFILCILLVGVSSLTVLASNDTTITVTADKTAVHRGDTVTVTVSVSGTVPFTSMGYIQDRDSAYFTVSKGILQPALEEPAAPGIKGFSKSAGFAVGGFMDYTTNEYTAVTINGDILVLTITINSDAPTGSFKVTDLVNVMNNTTEIPFTLVEESITVLDSHNYKPQNTGNTQTHALICTNCGDIQTESHSWDAGKITTPPTADKEGEKTFTCICGATKTQSVPKLEDPAPVEITVFTVKTDKTTVHRGDTVQVEVLMEGNELWTTFGYRHNADSPFFTVGKHTFGEALDEPGSAAVKNFTKKDGLLVSGYTDWETEEDIAVTVNGVILTIPITIKDDAPLSTFTVSKDANIKNGSNQLPFSILEDVITVVCDHKNCTYAVLDETMHKLSCTDCGLEDVANHQWDEGTVTAEPTCNETGTRTYTCICGDTKAETLPATNVHTFTPWAAVDGMTHARTCSVCLKEETGSHSCTNGVCSDCSWKEPYTVIFANEDGTVISTATYYYGDTVQVPADPTKAPDAMYIYVFAGWDKEIVPVTGNATYTAKFNQIPNIPDLDGNGELTDADAVYLLRHTLFPEDYPSNSNMDINCDGQVTDADAVYLLRHTLFPEDYPLYPKKDEQ